MCTPFMTVVVPVYNAGSYLKFALNDIIEQTYRNFELIVVDDGSTDDNKDLLLNLKNTYKYVKIIFQEHANGGVARNTGLKYATGEYILFLDQDDRFEPSMLKTIASEVSQKSLDVFVFNGNRFRQNENKFLPATNLLRFDILSEESTTKQILSCHDRKNKVLQFTGTTVWNKAFKREFLLKNDIWFQSNPGNDTVSFTITALCCAEKIGYCPQILIHYREGNPTGQIAQQDNWPTSIYSALSQAKSELTRRGKLRDYYWTFLQCAAEKCLKRFELLQTVYGKRKLYQLLHEQGLSELGLTSDCMMESRLLSYRYKVNSILKCNTYEEYLHSRQHVMQKAGVLGRSIYLMPQLPIDEGCSIILYGCGSVGKSYYIQLMNQTKYNVILWVDKNYEEIGFPIVSPKYIFSTKYHLILIAVKQDKTAEDIIKYLVEGGVPKEFIFWELPKII